MAKKRPVYLKGLGDLYIKAQRADNPALVVTENESLTGWAAVGTATLSLSQQQLLNGIYSLKVDTGAVDSGAELAFSPDADWSDYEDKYLLVNVYVTAGTPTITVKIEETTHSESFTYATVVGWNRVLIDLSDPAATSGTTDWSAIDTIGITSSTNADFYIDGIYFFNSINDVERDENVRIGCINEIGLETSDDSVELRCSRNEIVETEIVSTEITLSATVRDFDPAGMALLSAGETFTSNVTKLIEGESFTVPTTPFQYTLAEAANLKIGDGYGVWVRKAETGEILQETPDATIVPAGYYHVNPATGVVTFSSSEAGIAMIVDYNVTVSQGRRLLVGSDRNFKEFAVQFQVKGSNGKTALFFAPRVKSSSFSMEPALDDFWSWALEGRVLADENGTYYEFHVAD